MLKLIKELWLKHLFFVQLYWRRSPFIFGALVSLFNLEHMFLLNKSARKIWIILTSSISCIITDFGQPISSLCKPTFKKKAGKSANL